MCLVAPEVIQTSGRTNSKCDIWSLGCTIIELMTGKPPFSEINQAQAMFRIVEDEITIPEGFSDVKFNILSIQNKKKRFCVPKLNLNKPNPHKIKNEKVK